MCGFAGGIPIVWRGFCKIRNKINKALKNFFSLVPANITWKLFQSLLTVPFGHFCHIFLAKESVKKL
jgi:hypothetical protein